MEWKLTFPSPVATAEFSKFVGILSAALSQHYFMLHNWIPHICSCFLSQFWNAIFLLLLFPYVCFTLLRKGFGFATLEADGLILFFYLSFHPCSTFPTVQTQKHQHFGCFWDLCSGLICVGKNVGWNAQHICTVMIFSMEDRLVLGQQAFMGISCGCWVAPLNYIGQI